MEQQVQIQYLLKYQGNEILFPFLPGCLDQFNNYCLNCLEGWDLNTIENVCFPICGNEVIEGNEQCDDGNLNNYDGCFQCKFECVQDCQICENGICQECNVGFEYDKQNEKCVTICGDGLLIPFGQEICDDGNKEKGDGCYNCIFECQQFCEKCIYFDCVKCLEGFNLLNDICNPIYGDKIVLKEECDDDNNNIVMMNVMNVKKFVLMIVMYVKRVYVKLIAKRNQDQDFILLMEYVNLNVEILQLQLKRIVMTEITLIIMDALNVNMLVNKIV
ncbi:unnamed protein product [Paramecium sonneborni]|uniref:Uncharacterized protein n=1 Tax=Paramecium sonneborni TaxID=65129 RepID=A0A8S1RGB6_9CILI|nr:unnamed protein product [Paramecium sonneborni]